MGYKVWIRGHLPWLYSGAPYVFLRNFPMLLLLSSYDVNKKTRTFVRYLGDATDDIGLSQGRQRSQVSNELMVVVTSGETSSLISPDKRTNNADLILLTLDARKGKNAEHALIIDAFEPAEGIASTEFPADIAMAPDGNARKRRLHAECRQFSCLDPLLIVVTSVVPYNALHLSLHAFPRRNIWRQTPSKNNG